MTGNQAERRGAIVGIDGSAGSLAALDWAIGHAEALGAIRPITAWDYPAIAWLPAPLSAAAVPPEADMQAAAEDAATAYALMLADVQSEAPIVRRGVASEVLLDASNDAKTLIVGTRGHGPILDSLLGSVGRRIADRTTVPLVIVPDGNDTTNDPSAPERPSATPLAERILVGVDGSPAATDALAWAIEFAKPEDEVIALTTWSTPVTVGMDVPRFDVNALRAEATNTVKETVAKVCADVGVSEDRVTCQISEGDPRWVLKEMENDVDLLVIGTRGHTGISHLLLGSTTTSLIHSPNCPVVVVP